MLGGGGRLSWSGEGSAAGDKKNEKNIKNEESKGAWPSEKERQDFVMGTRMRAQVLLEP
jgi:hypothetical protein